MSKIITWVVIVVVVGVGGYALFNNQLTNKGSVNENTGVVGPSTEVAMEGKEEAGAKKMPFSEFIKQNGTYKCTVNQNVAGIDTVGTTYIDGEMIRGEYNTKVQNLNVDSTLIVRDGYTYTWTSMAPNMGFKSKVVKEDAVAYQDAGVSGQYSFNAEQIGDYSCEPWVSDASKFALPSGITFNELAY